MSSNEGIHLKYQELTDEEFDNAKKEVNNVPNDLHEVILNNVCFTMVQCKKLKENNIKEVNSDTEEYKEFNIAICECLIIPCC